ncbi:hypothetical protein GCM10025768_12310 [Microbacterium pseudoresistens]|uniref:DUF4395 domain-containing protein n=1 Tax=Microbacterium pseudoresistens TaxID=640634 RepID=A0A7Y9JPY1_9MICO|nr:DUF4395 domain-containing protein [Microbacterium pseudoresistens]NYD55134.1 hypothetical protein [Microbacterium pseudoresistens]
MTTPAGIDPRGPRFGASITSALLLVATALALTGISTARGVSGYVAVQTLTDASFDIPGGWALPQATVPERVVDAGFLLTLVVALLFAWSLVSSRTQPWNALFRTLVRPRLSPPAELEDPRPPRFAQGVGLIVVGIGLVLHLLGVPWALPVATAAAFVAAFLNAAFGFCLGCQIWLLLQRAGLVGRSTGGSSATA